MAARHPQLRLMCAMRKQELAPKAGVYVYFNASLGSLSSSSGRTDSSGRARTYLTSTSAGYTDIRATTAGGRGDTTVVTCFAVSITSPSSFPAYTGVNCSLKSCSGNQRQLLLVKGKRAGKRNIFCAQQRGCKFFFRYSRSL